MRKNFAPNNLILLGHFVPIEGCNKARFFLCGCVLLFCKLCAGFAKLSEQFYSIGSVIGVMSFVLYKQKNKSDHLLPINRIQGMEGTPPQDL